MNLNYVKTLIFRWLAGFPLNPLERAIFKFVVSAVISALALALPQILGDGVNNFNWLLFGERVGGVAIAFALYKLAMTYTPGDQLVTSVLKAQVEKQEAPLGINVPLDGPDVLSYAPPTVPSPAVEAAPASAPAGEDLQATAPRPIILAKAKQA